MRTTRMRVGKLVDGSFWVILQCLFQSIRPNASMNWGLLDTSSMSTLDPTPTLTATVEFTTTPVSAYIANPGLFE
jgi:hypothetical protein